MFPHGLRYPALLLVTAGLVQADSAFDAFQNSAIEWAKLRSEASRLETSWSTDRTLLEATITALEERAKLLREKRDLLASQTADDLAELSGFEEKNRQSAQALKAADEHLRSVTQSLLALRRRLPPRLSKALSLPYESLQDSSLSAAERMQHSLTILTRCLQFNRTFTYSEEAISFNRDQPGKLLQVIYWGLAQGYAYDQATQKAFRGSPGETGWDWVEIPNGAEAVKKLIASNQGTLDPEFIALPLQFAVSSGASGKGGTP